MMTPLVAAATAAVLAFFFTPAVRAFARRVGVLDAPGARKVHQRATPRLGGVAVLPASMLALAVTHEPYAALAPLALGSLVVFGAGVYDDVRGLRPLAKLAAITAAAVIAMAGGIRIERFTLFSHTYELGMLWAPITLAWIVGVTNAFNLIDGLDGLAAGLTIVAGGSCAFLLALRGDIAQSAILAALAGAAVGFLPYNFNPASIFLGDCGSLVVGFVMAATAITGWQKGATALAVGAPLLALALPIADVIGSIVRRLARRQSVFAADERHIHHWLLRLGLSHRGAVLVLYACALALAAAAVLTADYR